MILLSELLDEDGEAAAQAKQMGLVSKGWGRWADPRTGKVTHKTDGGQLVAVDPQQQEPSGGQEPDLDRVAKDLGDKPKSKYDDPKYKTGDWWDDPKLQGEPDNEKRPSDMSTGNPKYDKFLNAVEDRVRNLDVNVGDRYSPEEFAQKSGIGPKQQKAYEKLYSSTETWEVPAFHVMKNREGKDYVFIPDPQDV